MFTSRNKTILALLLCLLLLPCGALADDLIDTSLLVPESANYKTETMEKSTYVKKSMTSGSQRYIVSEDVKLEEGTARLGKLHVTRNQKVKKGDLIAEYTMVGSRADLENMKLSLQRLTEDYARISKEKSDALEEQAKDLRTITDPHEMKLAQLKLEQSRLAYERYVYETEYEIAGRQKEIDEREEYLNSCALYAPFDGQITWITTRNVGDTIYKGTAIATVQSREKYVIGIDNSNGFFKYGMRVQVGIGPKNKKVYYDGRIISCANVLPPRVDYTYALIELEEDIGDIGQKNISVEARTINLDGVLLISRKALTLEGGKTYVSILEGDMVQKRIVVTGHTSTTETWVVQGLEEGQQVIID